MMNLIYLISIGTTIFLGIYPAALLMAVVMAVDIFYLKPEVDQADMEVAATGVEGDDGKRADGCFYIFLLVVVLLFAYGAVSVTMEGGM